MNEPKRFDYLSDGMWENSAGDFVLHSDYASLKAEVERLISVSEAWKKRRLDKVDAECIDWSDYEKLKSENARLKAEVERLQNNCDYLDKTLDDEIDKTAMLCGQVERLRKAGDAMALSVSADWAINGPDDGTEPESVKAWNAAKEGKPSV